MVVVIVSVRGDWGVVTFAVTYGIGFGGIAYRYRRKVKMFFQRRGLDNYCGLLLLAIIVTITEETITFTGKNDGETKYLVGVILPFILTIPVAVVLFIVLSVFNISVSP
ncbi:hypothetical protein [Archaeoglobus neptunius]|uniref:hypothetical protein n=1 Tax=Archaeoglobus neptunius TaxID=2798580 RepID=UPI001E4311A2|nr:hypothetical protein [Archaeoglobus neptunius]